MCLVQTSLGQSFRSSNASGRRLADAVSHASRHEAGSTSAVCSRDDKRRRWQGEERADHDPPLRVDGKMVREIRKQPRCRTPCGSQIARLKRTLTKPLPYFVGRGGTKSQTEKPAALRTCGQVFICAHSKPQKRDGQFANCPYKSRRDDDRNSLQHFGPSW